MPEDIEVKVVVDDTEFKAKHKEIIQTVAVENKLIEEVDKKAGESFATVLNMARGAYLLVLGMVKSTGASVSYFFRSMISSVFSTISMLHPLFLAMKAGGIGTMNPLMIAQASFGLFSLAASISAAYQAERGYTETARGMRGLDMSLLVLQQLLQNMNFL